MTGSAAGRFRLRIRPSRLSADISARDFRLAAILIGKVADIFDRTRDHGRDLAGDLAIARNLATALDLALDRDLGAALDCARKLAVALDIATARAYDFALTSAYALTHDLDLACGLAHDFAEVLERAGVAAGAAGVGGRSQRRVTAAAARLLTMAAGLLPTPDRARYAAEFRSELWELAQAGTARRAQVAYAARQVQSAVRLRAALRAPARRGAVP